MRTTDGRREAIILHALLAKPHGRRVNEHGNVEALAELKEGQRVVVVRIGAAMTGGDQHASEIEFFHGALQLTQMLVAAAGNGGGERHHAGFVLVAQAREIIIGVTQFSDSLFARKRLEEITLQSSPCASCTRSTFSIVAGHLPCQIGRACSRGG